MEVLSGKGNDDARVGSVGGNRTNRCHNSICGIWDSAGRKAEKAGKATIMDEVPKCPDCLCAFLGVMIRVEIKGSRKRMRIARCPQCGNEYAFIKLTKLIKPEKGRQPGAQKAPTRAEDAP